MRYDYLWTVRGVLGGCLVPEISGVENRRFFLKKKSYGFFKETYLENVANTFLV